MKALLLLLLFLVVLECGRPQSYTEQANASFEELGGSSGSRLDGVTSSASPNDHFIVTRRHVGVSVGVGVALPGVAAAAATTTTTTTPTTTTTNTAAAVAAAASAASTKAATIGSVMCPAGTFISVVDGKSCTKCAAGTFSSTPGASMCLPCSAGSFSSYVGASSCTAAPPRFHVPTAGASAYLPCPKSLCSALGMTTCSPCPVVLTSFRVDYSCMHQAAWLKNKDNNYNSFLSTSTDVTSSFFYSSLYQWKVVSQGVPDYDRVFSASDVAALNARPFATQEFELGHTSAAQGEMYSLGSDLGYRKTASCSTGFWPPDTPCPVPKTEYEVFPLLPRPEASGGGCFVNSGEVGTFVNGAKMYSWNNGETFENAGVWHQVAAKFDALDTDLCGGKASSKGEYHHTAHPSCLMAKLGDKGEAQHSPIYGFAQDGYPLYGPFTAPNTLAKSCWKKRDYAASEKEGGCEGGGRSCLLVDNTDLAKGVFKVQPGQEGPHPVFGSVKTPSGKSIQAASGVFFEDMYYDALCYNEQRKTASTAASSSLNEHNGHDHDGLGFHYHVTIDQEEGAMFPFLIGPRFYGCIPGAACSKSIVKCANDTSAGNTGFFSQCGTTSQGVTASKAKCTQEATAVAVDSISSKNQNQITAQDFEVNKIEKNRVAATNRGGIETHLTDTTTTPSSVNVPMPSRAPTPSWLSLNFGFGSGSGGSYSGRGSGFSGHFSGHFSGSGGSYYSSMMNKNMMNSQVLCQPGFYSHTGYAPCYICLGGTISNSTGSRFCTTCPGGTVSTTSGLSYCNYQCPQGTYALSGSTACTLCGVGTYAAAIAQSSCTSVSPGFYTATNPQAPIDALSKVGRRSMMLLLAVARLTYRYAGPTLRLRRSSDNSVADFYADFAGNLGMLPNGTGTSLASWLQQSIMPPVTPASASISSTTFSYTGAHQNYTVSAGTNFIKVKMWGAGGAGGRYFSSSGQLYSGMSGGAGGYTTCFLSVVPGQKLIVMVGGGGKSGLTATTSAYGGGGVGYTDSSSMLLGNGGGRSAIRDLYGHELVTAGGGGGGGSGLGNQLTDLTCPAWGGSGGGLVGGSSFWGKGGTQTAGGTYFSSGSPGTKSFGASCIQGARKSGGGGGGYYGGACGDVSTTSTCASGGGGGSGFVGGCYNSGLPGTTMMMQGASANGSRLNLPLTSTVLPSNTGDLGYISTVGVGGMAMPYTIADPSPGYGGNGLVIIEALSSSTVPGGLPPVQTSIQVTSMSSSGAGSLQLILAPVLVNSAYMGPCFKIRRSNDSAKVDVFADAFGNYGLSIGTSNFLSWLGSSTAYVATWYDQSGSRNHATQSITTYSSASYTTNQQPILDPINKLLDLSAGQWMNLPDGTIPYGNSPYTLCSKSTVGIGNSDGPIIAQGPSNTASVANMAAIRMVSGQYQDSWDDTGGKSAIFGAYAPGNTVTSTYDQLSRRGYVNGQISQESLTRVETYNRAGQPQFAYVGKDYGDKRLRGQIYFVFVSNTSLADSDRVALETVAAPVIATASVVTWYDQSGNSRHATQSTITLQPVYDTTNNTIDFRPSKWMYITDKSVSTVPTGNAPYTVTFKYLTIDNDYGTVFGHGSTQSSGNGNNQVYCQKYLNAMNCGFRATNIPFGYYAPSNVISEVFDGSNIQGYIDGAFQHLPTTASSSLTRNGVAVSGKTFLGTVDGGKSSTGQLSYLNGELYFLYIANMSLSNNDRKILETPLNFPAVDVGASATFSCPPGTFSLNTQCTPCSGGTYSSSRASSTCLFSPAGTFPVLVFPPVPLKGGEAYAVKQGNSSTLHANIIITDKTLLTGAGLYSVAVSSVPSYSSTSNPAVFPLGLNFAAAFDQDFSTYYLHDNTTNVDYKAPMTTISNTGQRLFGEWIQISLPQAISIVGYNVTAGIAAGNVPGPSNMPGEVYMLASNNGGQTWVIVDHQINLNLGNRLFVISTPPVVQYITFRLVMLSAVADVSISLSEFSLFGATPPADNSGAMAYIPCAAGFTSTPGSLSCTGCSAGQSSFTINGCQDLADGPYMYNVETGVQATYATRNSSLIYAGCYYVNEPSNLFGNSLVVPDESNLRTIPVPMYYSFASVPGTSPVSSCYSKCNALGYAVFGVQLAGAAYQCKCSQILPIYPTYATTANVGYAGMCSSCPGGDQLLTCGQSTSLALYIIASNQASLGLSQTQPQSSPLTIAVKVNCLGGAMLMAKIDGEQSNWNWQSILYTQYKLGAPIASPPAPAPINSTTLNPYWLMQTITVSDSGINGPIATDGNNFAVTDNPNYVFIYSMDPILGQAVLTANVTGSSGSLASVQGLALLGSMLAIGQTDVNTVLIYRWAPYTVSVLLQSLMIQANLQFGYSISMTTKYLAIGTNSPASPSVFVYYLVSSTSTWTQLSSFQGASNSGFSNSLCVCGNTLAVATGNGAGSGYFFTLSTTSMNLTSKISKGDTFGKYVTCAANTVVFASGSAFLFYAVKANDSSVQLTNMHANTGFVGNSRLFFNGKQLITYGASSTYLKVYNVANTTTNSLTASTMLRGVPADANMFPVFVGNLLVLASKTLTNIKIYSNQFMQQPNNTYTYLGCFNNYAWQVGYGNSSSEYVHFMNLEAHGTTYVDVCSKSCSNLGFSFFGVSRSFLGTTSGERCYCAPGLPTEVFNYQGCVPCDDYSSFTCGSRGGNPATYTTAVYSTLPTSSLEAYLDTTNYPNPTGVLYSKKEFRSTALWASLKLESMRVAFKDRASSLGFSDPKWTQQNGLKWLQLPVYSQTAIGVMNNGNFMTKPASLVRQTAPYSRTTWDAALGLSNTTATFLGSGACSQGGFYPGNPNVLATQCSCMIGNTGGDCNTWFEAEGFGCITSAGSNPNQNVAAGALQTTGKYRLSKKVFGFITGVPTRPQAVGAGFANAGTMCFACPKGKYSPSTGGICVNAPSGSYSNVVGATAALQCQQGTYSYPGFVVCATIPRGYYSVNGVGINACPIGTFSSASGTAAVSNATCVACAPGFFSNTLAATSCTPCGYGTFAKGYSSLSCTASELGFFATQSSTIFNPIAPSARRLERLLEAESTRRRGASLMEMQDADSSLFTLTYSPTYEPTLAPTIEIVAEDTRAALEVLESRRNIIGNDTYEVPEWMIGVENTHELHLREKAWLRKRELLATSQPSSVPSQQPTGEPTGKPSTFLVEPSMQPTQSPTQPSSVPSSVPTSTPSSMPTEFMSSNFYMSPAGFNSLSLILTTYLANPSYTGPLFTLRRSTDNSMADFYANNVGDLGTALYATGKSLSAWLGVQAQAYVVKWWDQSSRANHASFDSKSDSLGNPFWNKLGFRQPRYDAQRKLVDFSNDPAHNVYYPRLRLTPGTLPVGNVTFSFVAKHGKISGDLGTIFGQGATARKKSSISLSKSLNNLLPYVTSFCGCLDDSINFNFGNTIYGGSSVGAAVALETNSLSNALHGHAFPIPGYAASVTFDGSQVNGYVDSNYAGSMPLSMRTGWAGSNQKMNTSGLVGGWLGANGMGNSPLDGELYSLFVSTSVLSKMDIQILENSTYVSFGSDIVTPPNNFVIPNYLSSDATNQTYLCPAMDARLVMLDAGSLKGDTLLDLAEIAGSGDDFTHQSIVPAFTLANMAPFGYSSSSVSWFVYFYAGARYKRAFGLVVTVNINSGSAFASVSDAFDMPELGNSGEGVDPTGPRTTAWMVKLYTNGYVIKGLPIATCDVCDGYGLKGLVGGTIVDPSSYSLAATTQAPCPPGSYSSGSSSVCFVTPAGYFSNNMRSPGSNSFIMCGQGVYCPAGSALPIPCPQGTYNKLSGQSTCVPVPPGTYPNAGKFDVVTMMQTGGTGYLKCPPGTSGPTNGGYGGLTAAAQSSMALILALKLTNAAYTGPLFKFRRDSDGATADFFSDAQGNLGMGLGATGTSFSSWMMGSSTAYVATWYDQSGYGNHASQTSTSLQGIYDRANNFIDFTNGGWMNLPDGTIPYGNSPYTIVAKHGVINNENGDIIGQGYDGEVNSCCTVRRMGSQYRHFCLSTDYDFNSYAPGNIVTVSYDQLHRRGWVNHNFVSQQPTMNRNGDPARAMLANDDSEDVMNGQIYFVFVSNIALSDDDRLALENSLLSGVSSGTCMLCPVGKYASTFGNAHCATCPTGRFAYGVGSSFCTTCSDGKIANGNNCDTCSQPGTFAFAGDSTCSQTGPGFYSTGDGLLKPCSTGLYSTTSGATSCNLCPLKYTSTSTNNGCKGMPDGKYANFTVTINGFSTQKIDVYCLAESILLAKMDGRFSNWAYTSPLWTSQNATLNPTSGASYDQLEMRTEAFGSVKLANLRIGFARISSPFVSKWLKIPLPSPSILTNLIGNPNSTFTGPSTLAQRALWDAALYGVMSSAFSDQVACNEQGINMINDAGSVKARIGIMGSTLSGNCSMSSSAQGLGIFAQGSSSPSVGASHSSLHVPLFAYLLGDAHLESGNGIIATSCALCAPGKYAVQQGLCHLAPAGSFVPREGSTSFTLCPVGRYSSSGASVCLIVPAGGYSNSGSFNGSAGYTKCPAGKFSATPGALSSATCVKCSAGKVTVMAGSKNCSNVSPGYYSASGVMTPCQAGFYSLGGNVSSCLPCPGGFFSASASSSCKHARPGFYVSTPSAATAEIPCSPGYFSKTRGATSCIACPATTYHSGFKDCTSSGDGIFTFLTGVNRTLTVNCVGGYVLLAKIDGRNPNWYYSSALWTSPTVRYNRTSLAMDHVEARLDAYTSVPVKAIKVSVAQINPPQDNSKLSTFSSRSNWLSMPISSKEEISLQQALSYSPFVAADVDASVTQSQWDRVFNNYPALGITYPLCPTNGFNILLGSVKARIGFFGSTGDCFSPGVVAGMGLSTILGNKAAGILFDSGLAQPVPSFFAYLAGVPVTHWGDVAAQCKPCPAGTWSNVTATVVCNPCPPGYSSAAGSSSCTACPLYTYQPTPGGLCRACGSASTSTGATSCIFPSSRPTGRPTAFTAPSRPTGQPTSRPTSPTGQPTRLPTGQPTSGPTESAPSGTPLSMPSSHPSNQPSGVPSGQPSIHPTRFPTSQPSSRPTSAPFTNTPTSHPSAHPLTAPTSYPTSRPTSQPSSSKLAIQLTDLELSQSPASYQTINLFAFAVLTKQGSVVTWGDALLGGNSSSVSAYISSGVKAIVSGQYSFAALKFDGSVYSWGKNSHPSSASAALLTSGVVSIVSNEYAYAALKDDGSVVCFGHPRYGGDISSQSVANPWDRDVIIKLSSVFVQFSTIRVVSLYATSGAFAAKMSNGEVVAWGDKLAGGGVSSASMPSLENVKFIYSNRAAFVAVKSDSSLVSWGNAMYGGGADLKGITTSYFIFSNTRSFAVVNHGRRVEAFGDVSVGGGGPSSSSLAVKGISSNDKAFACVNVDGTVTSWGDEKYGGDGSEYITSTIRNAAKIYGNGMAFAALMLDGSVITWGEALSGGDSSSVSSQLTNVVTIYGTRRAFAAITGDGRVVTWGWPAHGGDSSAVSDKLLNGVSTICSNDVAFAAIMLDGTVVSWPPYNEYGGDSSHAASMNLFVNVQKCAKGSYTPPITTGDTSLPYDCNSAPKSGLTQIAPNGDVQNPVTVYCDVDTPGGPWMLTYAYKHNSEQNNLPRPGIIPTDPLNGYSHVTLNNIPGFKPSDIAAVRFACQTSAHTRKVNFYVTDPAVLSIAYGSNVSLINGDVTHYTAAYRTLPGHTATLPGSATYTVSQRDFIDSPFGSASHKWTIFGDSNKSLSESTSYYYRNTGLVDLTTADNPIVATSAPGAPTMAPTMVGDTIAPTYQHTLRPTRAPTPRPTPTPAPSPAPSTLAPTYVSTAFSYTGGAQTYTVPSGITSLFVQLWGAGGGGGTSRGGSPQIGFGGGAGGYTECVISVTPGSTLSVIVGGGGQMTSQGSSQAGGYGGGGASKEGNGAFGNGGGGGRSAIRSVANGDDLVTAGGGGGGGCSCCSAATMNPSFSGGGGGGGLNGLDAVGTGGSQTSGGTGPTGLYGDCGSGSKYQGGTPGRDEGAGGGGGYYGGSSGNAMTDDKRGGAGGSSFIGGCYNSAFTQAGSSGTTSGQANTYNMAAASYAAGVALGGLPGTGSGNGGNGRVVFTPRS